MKTVKLTKIHLFIILLLVSLTPVTDQLKEHMTGSGYFGKTKDEEEADDDDYGGSFGGDKGLYARRDFTGEGHGDEPEDDDDEDEYELEEHEKLKYTPKIPVVNQPTTTTTTNQPTSKTNVEENTSGINFSNSPVLS